MKKSYIFILCWCLLFPFFEEQNLLAQTRPFRDTITICNGDTAQLEGWINLIHCPCQLGPCSPFPQPGGRWESPTETICDGCIFTKVFPTTTTLYQHTTPDYRCPPPPPGSGPQPPPGPTYFGGLVETLVIVKDCPRPCASTRGTFFFEDCDDGTPFFFVKLSDGRVLDPYFAAGIDFEVKQGQKVNFDYTPALFPTPCSIAEQAVILTCVEEEIIPARPTKNCVCDLCEVSNPLTLPWVKEILSLPFNTGMNVYWDPVSKQTLLGDILVFPDAVTTLYDCEGNEICYFGGIGGPNIHNCPFDPSTLELIGSFQKPSEDSLCGSDGNTYLSYCAAECIGVEIVGEGACPSPSKNLFSIYPWLNGIVDTLDCNGTIISEYDLGPYAFVYVEKWYESVLFFQDGTYYCFTSPGYDCLSLYGLTDADLTTQYVCGEKFVEFPWLNDVLNMGDCCENTQVIEYKSGIFSYIYILRSSSCNDGLGDIYFQDGTFYCGEVPNYSCLAGYGFQPSDGKVIWECSSTSRAKTPSIQQVVIKKEQTTQMTVFPNPATTVINIEIEDQQRTGQLLLYDLNGRIILNRKLEASSFTNTKLDVSRYEKGIYILEWRANGHSIVKKVLKQ